jgi:hypothetical protein
MVKPAHFVKSATAKTRPRIRRPRTFRGAAGAIRTIALIIVVNGLATAAFLGTVSFVVGGDLDEFINALVR